MFPVLTGVTFLQTQMLLGSVPAALDLVLTQSSFVLLTPRTPQHTARKTGAAKDDM